MKLLQFATVIAALSVAGLQGCAATPVETPPEGAQKEYVTGSNIPRKDKMGVKTMSKEEIDMLQTRPGTPYNPDRP